MIRLGTLLLSLGLTEEEEEEQRALPNFCGAGGFHT